MIRFLHLGEVLELHRQLIITSGGSPGLRDLGLLEAAMSQPRQTFAGEDLYPTLIDKAACLGFSLVTNHPFVDGNKRIGHAATEVMLMLNGHELRASVDAAEATILAVASGGLDRRAYTSWVERHGHLLT
ncbi:MAG: type II toxin-antitoxin system death-on-curing family toxin [Cyanobium sp.]